MKVCFRHLQLLSISSINPLNYLSAAYLQYLWSLEYLKVQMKSSQYLPFLCLGSPPTLHCLHLSKLPNSHNPISLCTIDVLDFWSNHSDVSLSNIWETHGTYCCRWPKRFQGECLAVLPLGGESKWLAIATNGDNILVFDSARLKNGISKTLGLSDTPGIVCPFKIACEIGNKNKMI